MFQLGEFPPKTKGKIIRPSLIEASVSRHQTKCNAAEMMIGSRIDHHERTHDHWRLSAESGIRYRTTRFYLLIGDVRTRRGAGQRSRSSEASDATRNGSRSAEMSHGSRYAHRRNASHIRKSLVSRKMFSNQRVLEVSKKSLKGIQTRNTKNCVGRMIRVPRSLGN